MGKIYNGRRLIEKHGEGIIGDFTRVTKDIDITLASLGRKYGFSRERARQIYRVVNGVEYTEVKRGKSQKRRDLGNVGHRKRKK